MIEEDEEDETEEIEDEEDIVTDAASSGLMMDGESYKKVAPPKSKVALSVGVDKEKATKLVRIMFGPIPVPIWFMRELWKQLPDDTVMVGYTSDHESCQWGWILSSHKFQKLSEGEKIPILTVVANGATKTLEITSDRIEIDFSSALADL